MLVLKFATFFLCVALPLRRPLVTCFFCIGLFQFVPLSFFVLVWSSAGSSLIVNRCFRHERSHPNNRLQRTALRRLYRIVPQTARAAAEACVGLTSKTSYLFEGNFAMIQVARSQVRNLLPLRCPSTSLPSRRLLHLRRLAPVRSLFFSRRRSIFGSWFVNGSSVHLPRAVAPQQPLAADGCSPPLQERVANRSRRR